MKRHPLTSPPSRSLLSAALRILWAFALVVYSTAGAMAQQGGSYEIKQSVIAGGGGNSNGGSYQLTGTTGQPALGSSSGGFFALLWGFWPDAEFLPLLTTASASPTANAAHWHNQDPTITLTATGGTPPRSINYSAAGAQAIAPTTVNSSSTSFFINQDGTTTISYHATDAAGKVEATQTLTIKLDKVAPDVVINSPTATNYDLNQQVQASYNCSDTRSGVESCTGTLPNQSLIDTSVPGSYTFNVTGADFAGNQTVQTVNYTVSSAPPAQGKKVAAADGAADDYFGATVAISGDTAIVGVQNDDNGDHIDHGSAYILERNAGGANNWGVVKKLIAADAVHADRFGSAVAISGDLAVVGKPTAGVFQSGAAYIFSRNAGGVNNWGLIKKLDVDEYYGSVVGISGDTVIIGRSGGVAGGEGGPGEEEPRKIYVFERNTGGTNNWGEVKVIQVATESIYVAAISGDTIAAVAFGESTPAGSVFIFERNAGGANNWGETKRLMPSDDYTFNLSVAISGDTVAVGASFFTSIFVPAQTEVYIFDRNVGGAGNWGEVKKIAEVEPGDKFGSAVSLSGDKLIVGAAGDDPQGELNAGAAYIFERNSGGANNWGQLRKLTAADSAEGDSFGSAVALSGTTAIVGVPHDDIGGNTDQGSVCIFDNQ
ncbi:MAG TPA: hypothetical protein VFZ40_01500 [Pyrinomonadaceae bacterium]